MDQTISAALAQCANLYRQRHLAQQVVVPVNLVYHFEGPDPEDASFQDTADANLNGQLLYTPFHAETIGSGGASHAPRLALIPDTLTAILQGRGEAQAAQAGGDVPIPALHVSISGPLPLPLGAAGAWVAVQSSMNLILDFSSAFGETVTPIELKTVNLNGVVGVSTVTLHLGNAELVFSPAVFGPVNAHFALQRRKVAAAAR